MGNGHANTHAGIIISNPRYKPPRPSSSIKKSKTMPAQIDSPVIMCANCSMEMYVPSGDHIKRFKCPHCSMIFNSDDVRTAVGFICNVHRCSCKCFRGRESSASHLPAAGRTRGVTKRAVSSDAKSKRAIPPSKEQPPPMATVCLNCGHKRSMHNITEKEMNRKKIVVPPDWITQDWTVAVRHPVTTKMRTLVQELMDSTWKNIITRDRDGKHEVPKFEPVQVLRNQNADIWKRYVLKRDVIRAEMKKTKASSVSSPARTAAASKFVAKTESFYKLAKERKLIDSDRLQSDINEVFLFHGTNPSAAISICDNDFKKSFAGTNKGTLYGHGLYFAESSSKSDEYAGDDADGAYQGLYATLLCRIVLGIPMVNEELSPDTRAISSNIQHTDFHSVVGDREKIRGTFREFVIFDTDQVYPEFVIIYRRVANTVP